MKGISSLRKIAASDFFHMVMSAQAIALAAHRLGSEGLPSAVYLFVAIALVAAVLLLHRLVVAYTHFFAFLSSVLIFLSSFPITSDHGVLAALAAASIAMRSVLIASTAKAFRRLRRVFPEKEFSIAGRYALLILAAAGAVAYAFRLGADDGIWTYAIAAICFVASVFFSCRNPITFREQSRLDAFFAEAGRPDSSDAILENIRRRIKEHWIDNYSFPLVENIIMFLVRVLFHLKIVGANNIREDNLPAVFVSNHGTMIGPVCGVTYLPVVHRPYVHHRMCDAEESAQRMWRWTFSPKMKHLTEEQGMRFSRFVAKRTSKWINSFEPIKSYVDLNDARKSMESIRNGVHALMDGDSVLLFPEDSSKGPDEKYQLGEAGVFFTGFAHMGKIYNEMTGRSLSFYPVFVDKKTRTYNIDEPVIYDSAANVSLEKKRVADELRRRMNCYYSAE
ncbi:MAG TPA: hypothetical protein DCO86_00410 [Spirochaetaceae bacterium]|nr:hypothetical protein [Spirochaetaceae bacterium]